MDLVVLAAPISENRTLLSKLAPTEALVTDAASTKSEIVAEAKRLGLRFVGGHPMAGSQLAGVANAREDLFRGSLPHHNQPSTSFQPLSAHVSPLCSLHRRSLRSPRPLPSRDQIPRSTHTHSRDIPPCSPADRTLIQHAGTRHRRCPPTPTGSRARRAAVISLLRLPRKSHRHTLMRHCSMARLAVAQRPQQPGPPTREAH